MESCTMPCDFMYQRGLVAVIRKFGASGRSVSYQPWRRGDKTLRVWVPGPLTAALLESYVDRACDTLKYLKAKGHPKATLADCI